MCEEIQLLRWNKCPDLIAEPHVIGHREYSFVPQKTHELSHGLFSQILNLPERSGRFKYWIGDDCEPLSDGWWFWHQCEACGYELPPNGRFDVDLKWGVPDNHKTPTPEGPQLTHDDRLISASLVSELDRMYRDGTLILGTAESGIIAAVDPLDNLSFDS